MLSLALPLAVSRAQSAVTTTFTYDAVGNRVAVTNVVRLTQPQVFSVEPQVGLFGQRANIFGRNLPPGDGTGYTVTFNGVPAAIVSVAPNVITVEVPSGASTGSLIVTLPDASTIDLGTFHVQGVSISPPGASVLFGHPVQFSAQVIGAADPSVTWELILPPMPGAGGLILNPGTLTPSGLYTPPPVSALSPAPVVIVRATSIELTGVSAAALVRLFGTTTQQPYIIALAPDAGTVDGLPPNITIGAPAVAALVPDIGEPGGLELNIHVAGPPILLLTPNEGNVDGLPPNTTVAQPPVTVEIEPN
jgi:hypothetical protein